MHRKIRGKTMTSCANRTTGKNRPETHRGPQGRRCILLDGLPAPPLRILAPTNDANNADEKARTKLCSGLEHTVARLDSSPKALFRTALHACMLSRLEHVPAVYHSYSTGSVMFCQHEECGHADVDIYATF